MHTIGSQRQRTSCRCCAQPHSEVTYHKHPEPHADTNQAQRPHPSFTPGRTGAATAPSCPVQGRVPVHGRGRSWRHAALGRAGTSRTHRRAAPALAPSSRRLAPAPAAAARHKVRLGADTYVQECTGGRMQGLHMLWPTEVTLEPSNASSHVATWPKRSAASGASQQLDLSASDTTCAAALSSIPAQAILHSLMFETTCFLPCLPIACG